jgi:hypothetical protein
MEQAGRSPSRTASLWFPLALMLAALALRVAGQQKWIEGLPNLSPLMAFAFAGAIVLPRPLPWWSWLIMLLGVDLLSQGAAVWSPENLPVIVLTYFCYVLAAWWGSRMRQRGPGVANTLTGTVTCSVLFYLITNTFCWATEAIHPKTFEGWMQCLVTGTPGLPPTWMFFRNSLVADLIGACVLLLAYNGEAVMRGVRGLPWTGKLKASAAT